MAAIERQRNPDGTFPRSGMVSATRHERDVVAPVELTDEQKQQMIALIRAEHENGVELGNVAALRRIGLTGRSTDLRAAIDDELKDLCREARGWNLTAVKAAAWEVAVDKEHPSWDRANSRILRAYGGAKFNDHATVEVEHTGLVRVEHERRLTLADVAAFDRALDGSQPRVVDVVPGAQPLAELAEGEPPASGAASR